MMYLVALFALLTFALVFYLLQKSGWAAEIAHGAHVVHGSPATANVTAGSISDPVCGMEVATGERWSVTHKDVTYLFCSKSCRMRFLADPESYVSEVSKSAPEPAPSGKVSA